MQGTKSCLGWERQGGDMSVGHTQVIDSWFQLLQTVAFAGERLPNKVAARGGEEEDDEAALEAAPPPQQQLDLRKRTAVLVANYRSALNGLLAQLLRNFSVGALCLIHYRWFGLFCDAQNLFEVDA